MSVSRSPPAHQLFFCMIEILSSASGAILGSLLAGRREAQCHCHCQCASGPDSEVLDLLRGQLERCGPQQLAPAGGDGGSSAGLVITSILVGWLTAGIAVAICWYLLRPRVPDSALTAGSAALTDRRTEASPVTLRGPRTPSTK